MLHCYNCGNEMPDNLLFCTKCGKKLELPTEVETQVLAHGAPATVITAPVKKRSGLKAVVIAIAALGLIGVVGVAIAAMVWNFSRRQSVIVNSQPTNVNAMMANANSALANVQKAANDAANAANAASSPAVNKAPAGKVLDGSATRIKFSPGAVSATVSGVIKERATFVLRARAGQLLTANIRAGSGCVKFYPSESALGFTTSEGDNSIDMLNTCDKPSPMTMIVTVR